MSKVRDDIVEVEGVVTELLPNAYFMVKLKNDKNVVAHASGKIRKGRIRILVGDRVLLEMSKYDLTKGRIVHRYKV